MNVNYFGIILKLWRIIIIYHGLWRGILMKSSLATKLSGLSPSRTRIREFHNCLNHYNLIDLGFKGSRFTWSILKSLLGLIQERIDCALANPYWRLQFLNAMITHLPWVYYHCPILISLENLIAMYRITLLDFSWYGLIILSLNTLWRSLKIFFGGRN